MARMLTRSKSTTELAPFAARFSAVVILAIAGGLVLECTKVVYRALPQAELKYMPWEIYRTFRPAIDAGVVLER